MKKTLMLSVLMLFLVSAIGMVSANCNSGSIWTTRNDCGEKPQGQQNVNQYAIGEDVYINGDNFCAGNYNWDITGQPNSGDPNTVVFSGNNAVNSTGSFCFKAYTIQTGDEGVYKVDFGGKQDTYNIQKNNIPIVPEFGLTVGILTVLGAVGTFFLVRKQ